MKANYLTLPEISRALDVNASVVAAWVENGSLPARRSPRGVPAVAALALVHWLLRRGMSLPRGLCSPVRTLVIDDEPAMLRSTARLLKRSAPHLDVRLAAGAATGFREIAEYPPEVVLLDMYMPELNGVECCLRIKQCASTRGILVIGVSGRRDPGLERDFSDAGAAGILDKPPDIQELLRLLEQGSFEPRP